MYACIPQELAMLTLTGAEMVERAVRPRACSRAADKRDPVCKLAKRVSYYMR